MGFDIKRLHLGIFGPGLSGKTTLAQYLSREYWQRHRIKSLVLDPNLDNWGKQAWVTDDEERFNDMVWNREINCALFIDEAAEMIKRDNDKTPLFTRVRHRNGGNGPGHRMHVIGHSGVNLLPQQRNQIHTLYLFKQSQSAAALWAEEFADQRIMQACNLSQYEFLYCKVWKEPRRLKLTL